MQLSNKYTGMLLSYEAACFNKSQSDKGKFTKNELQSPCHLFAMLIATHSLHCSSTRITKETVQIRHEHGLKCNMHDKFSIYEFTG